MGQLTMPPPPAACALQGLYRNLIHVTSYTHMIARLSATLVDKLPKVNSLVRHVKKVFEKCLRRVKEWENFQDTSRPKFPIPVITRWGTWLTSVVYISKHWVNLKCYLSTFPKGESSAARKALVEMEDPEILRTIGFLSAFEFLVPYSTLSEGVGFTAVKASSQIDKITEKLIELSETGNILSDLLLKKFQDLIQKNQGLRKVVEIARGNNAEILEPEEIGLLSFAPCTSVHVERLFSVLNAFVSDRPYILEETLNKLICLLSTILSFCNVRLMHVFSCLFLSVFA